jgi:hypothetical protein
VSLKLTIVMFINTGVIPILANFDKNNWFSQGGLCNDIFFIFLSLNFMRPLFYFLNGFYIYRRCKICREKRKPESKLSQREANLLYEAPQFDAPQRYADTMLVLMMTCFYTPFMPFLPVISFFGLLLQYWIEKIRLLKQNKIPEQMSEAMALAYSKIIPVCLFLYGFGNFIVVYILSDYKNHWVHIGLWVTFINMFIPMRSLCRYCEGDVSRKGAKTYQEVKHTFQTDYNRSNPITAQEATIDYLNMLIK